MSRITKVGRWTVRNHAILGKSCETLLGRVERRIDRSGDCWVWTGQVEHGYGQIKVARTTRRVHRLYWEMAHGPVPDGLQLDHLCRNRACVRLDHLEVVTPKENIARSPRVQATTCKRGHPLYGENMYRDRSGSRVCRTCKRAAWHIYNARRRDAA